MIGVPAIPSWVTSIDSVIPVQAVPVEDVHVPLADPFLSLSASQAAAEPLINPYLSNLIAF